MIPWKEKKDFYSAAAKVACRVGGPSPEGSMDVERKPETMGPANFHGYCAAFWESLLDSHSIIGVIDFTPGAGHLAEARMSLKIPILVLSRRPLQSAWSGDAFSSAHGTACASLALLTTRRLSGTSL